MLVEKLNGTLYIVGINHDHCGQEQGYEIEGLGAGDCIQEFGKRYHGKNLGEGLGTSCLRQKAGGR